MQSSFSAPLPEWVFYPKQHQQQHTQQNQQQQQNNHIAQGHLPRDPRQRQRVSTGSYSDGQLYPLDQATLSGCSSESGTLQQVEHLPSRVGAEGETAASGRQGDGQHLLNTLPPGADWEKLQQRIGDLRVALEQSYQTVGSCQQQV